MALDPKIVLLIGAETTSIIDESSYARTLTAVGNAARTIAQAKYGAASLTFDGTGDRVQAAASSDLAFGSGDFTIEGWFRFATKTTEQALMGQWEPATAQWWFLYITGGQLLFRDNIGSIRDLAYTWTPTLGQWYHIAVDRSGSTLRLYVNGAVVATDAAFSGAINSSSVIFTFGTIGTSSSFPSIDFNGQMDEIRITKGLAQYAGAFTPPTAPFSRGGIGLVGTVNEDFDTGGWSATGGTTPAMDTTGANLLVISVGWLGTTSPAVSDSKGNTWIPLTRYQSPSSSSHQIFYAKNAIVGTGHTFTISTSPTSTWPTATVYAVSGANTDPYQGESGAGAASVSVATGSVTPAVSGAFVVTGLRHGNGTTGSTSVTAPFSSNLTNITGGAAAYTIPATTAPLNPTWAFAGGTQGGAASIAVFLPAPTVVSSSSGRGLSTSSLTVSHTVPSGASILAVFCNISSAITTITCTYGGVSLTKTSDATASNNSGRLVVFELANPTVGTANVVLTSSAGSYSLCLCAISLANCTYLSLLTTAEGTSTAPSITISNAAGGVVFDIVGHALNNATMTVGAGQTSILEQESLADANRKLAVSSEAGAASVTMSWTTSVSGVWIIGALTAYVTIPSTLTSYTNPCGSGDRRALILVSSALAMSPTPSSFIDGNTTANAWFFASGSTTNIIEFWFPSKKIINEAKWYQQLTTAHGDWKWQGSNDRTTWTDIGGTFTLGGVATQTHTTLAGNTIGYVFYRLFQVSGAASSSPWIYEIEFKIGDVGTTSYVNLLGSGNRAIVTTSSGISWSGGTGTAVPSRLVDGAFALDLFWNATTVAGHWIQFDLGAAVVVQQARFWVDASRNEGDWLLQGSPDASTWTDISATVTLGSTPSTWGPMFVTCFGGGESNTTPYRYYRLLGVSGSRTTSTWLEEVEFMVGATTVVSPYASIAHWPFNEATGTTAVDASGNGHDATLVNGTWDTVTQKFGAAALKNTDGNYGASFASITLGTAYTISVWINGWDGSNDGILLGGPAENYAFYLTSTQVYHSSGASNFVSVTGAVGGLSGSHHLAVTRSGQTVKFYKDGVQVGTTQTLPNNTPLSLSTISGYPTGLFAFVGTLDDIRLHNVALNAAEVMTLYAFGSTVPVRVNTVAASVYTTASGTTMANSAQEVAAGNTLIIGATGGFSPSILAVTDTAGNTYIKVDHLVALDNYRQEMWYAKNVIRHAANIVTVTWSGATQYRSVIAIQYAGNVDPVNPFDGTAKGSVAGSNTSVTSGTLTTTRDAIHLIFSRLTGGTITFPAGFSANFSPDPNSVVSEKVENVFSGTYTLTDTNTSTPKHFIVGAFALATPLVPPGSRVTQLVVETLSFPTPDARVGQLAVETLSPFSSEARVTQDAIEVLSFDPVTSALRVTQLGVEMISSAGTSAGVRVTQVGVEMITVTITGGEKSFMFYD